jgi:beta-fructofuranosidase
MPDCCKIQARIAFAHGTHTFGAMLRVSEDLDCAYYVRFDPRAQTLRFEAWPPGFGKENFANIDEMPGAMAGLQRFVALSSDRPVNLQLIVDGSTLVVYVDQHVAMCCRMYDMPEGRWGFFVEQGSAEVTDIQLTAPADIRP